jgi:phosphatidylglycerophosphatase A
VNLRRKDAPEIVIDEVAGMLLALAFLPQARLSGWALFFIFLEHQYSFILIQDF